MKELERSVRTLITDIGLFTAKGGGLRLRSYQEAVARAVVDSVVGRRGLSFVVMFPRQSGKNELQAQIEAYLLSRYYRLGGEMVKVSPTWKPQSLNAMARLERALSRNLLTQTHWKKEWGYIYRVGRAKITFLSGAQRANIVGATASLLLEVDEAQDVDIVKYDKEIAPMAAANNATRVFWGTAWTSETLLAREMELIRRSERASSEPTPQRIFTLTADEVSLEVPEYGDFVQEQVNRLGREHPMVRTQFFSETIEAQAQLFPPARQAMMQGNHFELLNPLKGETYALLVDVGGATLTPTLSQSGRGGSAALTPSPDPSPIYDWRGESSGHDATAVTVVRMAIPAYDPGAGRFPIYQVVQRTRWVGLAQAELYKRIKALVEHWEAWRVVVDATGLGAGVASFLEQAYPGRVRPFVFTQQSKSQLRWDFIAAVETGRYKEYVALIPGEAELQEMFWREVRACEGVVLPGPGQVLRWGVPDGRKDAQTREVLHDDLLISAALCVVLDNEPVGLGVSVVIPPRDIFEGMGKVF
jgi:hypothetical protein